MALLKKWRDMAYSETANKGDLQRLWSQSGTGGRGRLTPRESGYYKS